MAWKGKTSERIRSARLRERQVLERRTNGESFEEIAKATGFKERTGAYKAYRRALADIPKAAADELRALESVRLDDAVAAIYERVVDGDLVAIDRLLRIIAVRARLLGLNVNRSLDLAVDVNAQKAYVGIPIDEV